MKGLMGICMAAMLGLGGAACNWLYLARQASGYEKVTFVGIAPTAQLSVGDRFRSEHLSPVSVPRLAAGGLDQTAVLWTARETVVGMAATKNYIGGELVLHQDLRTPARRGLSEKLADNERVMWLPVDTRTFEPTHVNPGDQVSFSMPRLAGSVPTPANSDSIPTTAGEIIGPFRILSLGSRIGSREVQKAQGLSTGRENMIAIAVRVEGGTLEPRAARLADALRQTNFQQVVVLLHPGERMDD